MVVNYIFLIMLIGTAVSQETKWTVPPDFTLSPGLGNIDLNQLMAAQNQTTPAIKKKCDENGGPAAYQQAQTAFQDFGVCIQNLVDVMQLQQEIDLAKPNGQIDEVFKKYCAKTPAFKKCFRDMIEAVKPCFTEKERVNLKIVYNVTEQLAEFICFKEGDRIALFIAEGGQECFVQKQEQLQDCFNSTFGAEIGPNNFSPDNVNLPDIAFEEKECHQLSQLQTCVVGALENCNASTTGNIVDSLFSFVRKATPCRDVVEKTSASPGSATGLAVTSITILMAITSMFF